LLPHLTVFENICFPLKVQGVETGKREARAREVIQLVGLEGREKSFPRQLSGGQQQRVGIARCLAVEPEIWFLDEPFSALDPLIRRQMQDEFLRLQKMLHKTIVFITHDFLEALRLADRIAIMKDGKVVQIGTPAQLVLNPENDYVAEFTKDVPRVRIITAGEIADPSLETAGINQHVDASATLEEIMPLFGENPGGIIVDREGTSLGLVTPGQVVSALAAAPDQH
jgi:glycine betaine/proline transport system ATP-binding protein